MSAPSRPFRRKLFYIPGYDPFPPRRYREIYRAEGAAQAAISGYSVTMLPSPPREKGSTQPYGWRATGLIDGQRAEMDAEVLIWSDIVKSSMSEGIAATYWQMLSTMWIYARSGAFFRQMRLRKGPTLAALYPVVTLTLQALLAGAVGLGVAWAAALLHPWLAVLGVLAAYGVLRAAKRFDNRILAHYLMHDFAFSAQYWGAYPPGLSQRMDGFATRIRAAFDGDYDEVLVVGHSSGAYMGVTILSDILRAGLPARRPALGFLSLGQVVPMVSFLPRATRLRGDLHYLCQSDQLTWVDVTAPGDGCAFAMVDPVAVTGVAPASGQRWPLITTCAFTQTMSDELRARLKYQFFRLHFQYLYAFDRVGFYDYFRISAGAQTLAQRYEGVGHSPSRMTRPLSGYRDTA